MGGGRLGVSGRLGVMGGGRLGVSGRLGISDRLTGRSRVDIGGRSRVDIGGRPRVLDAVVLRRLGRGVGWVPLVIKHRAMDLHQGCLGRSA
jgi:hypothetical protein